MDNLEAEAHKKGTETKPGRHHISPRCGAEVEVVVELDGELEVDGSRGGDGGGGVIGGEDGEGWK